MPQKLTKEEFVNRSILIKDFGKKNDYSLVNYAGTNTKVEIICKIHGTFWQLPSTHLSGHDGCQKCSFEAGYQKRVDSIFENIIKRANLKHNNFYDYSKSIYSGTKVKIEIICPKHGSFHQTVAGHLTGRGCSKCVGRNLTFKDLEKNCKDIHKNKYIYINFFNSGRFKYVKSICYIHGVFIQRYSHHINGAECPKCSECNKKTNEEFVNLSNIKHNFEYEYLTEYINTHKKILIKHKKCGYEFLQEAKFHLHYSTGCPKCNISKGEKVIREWLIENNIKFEEQKKFKEIGRMSYDFYLSDYNILIEYDGEQHFKPVKVWGGKEEFENNKKRDAIKNEYAKKNGIKLLRIPYTEFNRIEEMLESICLC